MESRLKGLYTFHIIFTISQKEISHPRNLPMNNIIIVQIIIMTVHYYAWNSTHLTLPTGELMSKPLLFDNAVIYTHH